MGFALILAVLKFAVILLSRLLLMRRMGLSPHFLNLLVLFCTRFINAWKGAS
jgi:hypothetical protein